MILETKHLILAEAAISDASFIFELLNSPTWIKHIGDRGIKTLQDAEKYIENSLLKSYRENGYGLYKVSLKNTNEPIGLCGLVNRPTLEHPDIGFALLPNYASRGFGFEAAAATLEFVKNQLHINPILAITSPDNHASKRLLEKIGLHRIGLIPLGEKQEEVLLYSTEFASPKA